MCWAWETKGILIYCWREMQKGTATLDSWVVSHKNRILLPYDIVKAMVFPVIMYRCESWTIKKAECRRIDSLELWCWRRLLRVSWAARRSNQSMLKEINPEHSLEGLMLKLQYFGHFIWRADSLEKTLMLGKIEGRRRRGVIEWDGWMASATQWAWVWANTGRQWRIGKPGVLQSLWFSNWTTTTYRL